MDQVDSIIFHNFMLLGWENESNIKKLQDLEVDDIAKLLVECISAISSNHDLPHNLPHNMSQRFRAAAKIAESIKELGYKGDLGYQSILYSNETDLRRIFTFLIEKLPKDAPILVKESLGKHCLIQKEAGKKVNEAFDKPWLLPHCLKVARKYRSLSNKNAPLVQYGTSHCNSFISDWYHCNQIISSFSGSFKGSESSLSLFNLPAETIFPTLLNSHAERIGKSLSDFVFEPDNDVESGLKDVQEWHSESSKYKNMKLNDVEDILQGMEKWGIFNELNIIKEDKELNSNLIPLQSQSAEQKEEVPNRYQKVREEAENKVKEMSAHINSVQEDLFAIQKSLEQENTLIATLREDEAALTERMSTNKKKLNILQKISSLVTEPEQNILKLKKSLEAQEEKEIKLKTQWSEFKMFLEEDLENVTSQLKKKKARQSKLESETADMKKRTQVLLEEAKQKELMLSRLNEEKNKVTKGVNRAVYTKQILDISSKVQKQKCEIDKILSETRIVQKEINNLTGKLQRTFAVVEDTSFKTASSNERARPIYRSVVSIHEECSNLVDVIRETGVTQREIADLQQQLNSEGAKQIEDNIKKLEADLNKLKTENSLLKTSRLSEIKSSTD